MPNSLIIFLAIAAPLLMLVLVLLAGAFKLKPTPVADPLPVSNITVDEGATWRFRQLLRCQTVWGAENSMQNHAPFDEFVPLLQRLYPQVFACLELTMVNTYGIMLLWKGINPSLSPIVLMAHHDVVGANSDEWTYPPYAAEIANGRIYARGAVDTKCILAGLLEATSSLLAQGYMPPRDIYICSSNCEEDMGDTAPAMVKFLTKKGITPAFVLDEGGAVIDNPPLGIKAQFAAIGVAEKGILNATITVSSKGGHAATPSKNDATSKLVFGLTKLLNHPAPARLSKPVEAMLKELGKHAGFGLRIVFGNLWLFRPLVLAVLKGNSETAAMLRTTYALTRLEGSTAINVIPRSANASLNIRIDPFESVDIAIKRLRGYFNFVSKDAKDNASEKISISFSEASEPSPISPYDNESFNYLAKVTHSVYPSAIIAPYVQSSATDARHFAKLCPNVYRFAGFLFKGNQRSAVHGKDENIDVESFTTGISFYIELIRNLDSFEQS